MSSSHPSVAMAGGGLIALSIAWRLAQNDFRVTVFERGTLGGEASWAGAGMLAPGGELDTYSPLADLALESRLLYPDFVRELEQASGLSIDYQECGGLDLAYTADEWDLLRDRVARQARFGVAAKTLTYNQVATFWPRVRTADLTGSFFYPGDAIVNPRELVLALASSCRALGVVLHEHTPIEHAQVSDQTVDVGNGQQFDALVIAAGAWSSSIVVENVGLLPAAAPVKGHLIGFRQPDQTCNTIVRHGHTYLLQRANGLLIAGASVEHVGWDRGIDSAVASTLAREASFLLPHLAETTPTEIWAGFRPGSDRLQLGSWQSPRLYLAYGHYRNGILLAPVTAAKLTREISANLQRH